MQVEFTADGDTLNYREKLFEKLSALPPVVASADARPTDAVVRGVPTSSPARPTNSCRR